MTATGYQFGPFRFDRVAYQVARGAEIVSLTPKLLDLLVYLLDRPATLVTKEELLDALWPTLAIIGTASSFGIRRVPAAAPHPTTERCYSSW